MRAPVLAALAPPEAVPSSDGLTHLAYELLLSNVLGQTVTLDAITVLGDGVELRLEGDDLAARMRPLGGSASSRVLTAGQQGIVYLDVTVAVGDGPIVSMGWDLPEEPPGKNPTGLAHSEYGGNHIVQDLGGGRFAFHAHLQGGNPEGFEVGQALTRGEAIVALGNSGNTDMPHLHFHVMDSPLPLSYNGLPFLIDSFTFAGTVGDAELTACMTASVPCAVDGSGSGVMTAKSPLYRDVLNIDE